MKSVIILLALLVWGCASSKPIVPSTSQKSVAAVDFTARARTEADWLIPMPTTEENSGPEIMELEPLAVYRDPQKGDFWVGGAMKVQSFVRRSFLFHSSDGIRWTEEQPAATSLAIVAIAPVKGGGIAVIDSNWVEGSSLVNVWELMDKKNWRKRPITRSTDEAKDPFRRDLGCCVEFVRKFDADFWRVTLEGNEKIAEYNTKDRGRTWKLRPGTLRPLVTEVIQKDWKKVDWQVATSWWEIRLVDTAFYLPKQWTFEKKGKELRLQPITGH